VCSESLATSACEAHILDGDAARSLNEMRQKRANENQDPSKYERAPLLLHLLVILAGVVFDSLGRNGKGSARWHQSMLLR
jgi:hypothetical protein